MTAVTDLHLYKKLTLLKLFKPIRVLTKWILV